MDAYINGQKVRLDPKHAIGKGGEADIFDIGGGLAAKIFKTPDHPDLLGFPNEQKAARARIAEHQHKLPAFPHGLPGRAVVPRELIRDRSGMIVGYTMPFISGAEVLLRYGERSFRDAGLSNQTVGQIFMDLHRTVDGLHQARLVIGDFNDLNVMVRGTEAHLIDVDSAQFGPYLTRVFTAKFVDPLLCTPRAKSLELASPHNDLSDWYAFAVMFMNSLLFVHPYGGVYRPKDPKKGLSHDSRPLHRITVFHPDVRYPKPAVPYGVLSDDLLDYFHKVFEKDQRGIFPWALIESLRWTKCVGCGLEHARRVCPACALPGAPKEVTRVRGKVMATKIFETRGVILHAAMHNGELFWLYHESGAFRREDKSVAMTGALDPQMRYRLSGRRTLFAKDGKLVTMDARSEPEAQSVDSYGLLPIFDANAVSRFWASGGALMRDGLLGPEQIGAVIDSQTLFWVGDEFGFGISRAGNLSLAFTFSATKKGINDTIKLPLIRGQLIDATCAFGKDRVWFFVVTREGGETVNRCVAIGADGAVLATAEAREGDGSWLSHIRGATAVGTLLFVPTDDGVVRVEVDGSQIVPTKEFPDTEPFVDSASRLFAGKNGLYVVGQKEIVLLKMS